MNRYDLLVNEKHDLLGRLKSLIEEVDPNPAILALAVVLLLAVLGLALFGRRRELLFLLISSAMLSGAVWPGVDTASTLFRWLILGLLAVNVLRLHTYFGLPMLLFLTYVFLGFGLIAFSSMFYWSLQTGGLYLMTSLAAVALADEMKDTAGIRRVLAFYIIGSLLWFAMGATSMRQLIAAKEVQEIGRVSGANVSVVVFVTVGGLLLPMALWAALSDQVKIVWRVVSGTMALGIVLMLFASGERSGTFAGVMGMVPLLLRKRVAPLLFVGGAVAVLALAAMQLSSVNQKQLTYRLERFTSADLTGRAEIWSDAVYECMQKPWMGHGLGSDREFTIKYLRPTHNAYLSAWYTHGIFGVILYLAAFAAAGWQTLVMTLNGRTQEIRELARVLMGVLIVEFAVGMVETFSSPSSFATITLVIVLVMIGRLHALAKEQPATSSPGYYWAWVPQVAQQPAMQPAVAPVEPRRDVPLVARRRVIGASSSAALRAASLERS